MAKCSRAASTCTNLLRLNIQGLEAVKLVVRALHITERQTLGTMMAVRPNQAACFWQTNTM